MLYKNNRHAKERLDKQKKKRENLKEKIRELKYGVAGDKDKQQFELKKKKKLKLE